MPPIALEFCLKSSKHCVKLAAATREAKNKRGKRARVEIGFMSWGGEQGDGGMGREGWKRATLLVFIGISVRRGKLECAHDC